MQIYNGKSSPISVPETKVSPQEGGKTIMVFTIHWLYDTTCVFPASYLMNMYDDSSVSPLPGDSEGVFNITI